MGLESLSDADLLALKSGDLSKVSDAGLLALKTPARDTSLLGKVSEINQALGKVGPAAMIGGAAHNLNEGIAKVSDWAGGGVTDFLANRGVSPEKAALAGTAVNTLGQTVAPSVVGTLAGKVLAPVMRSGAESLMTSALKPSVEMGLEKGAKAARTMLDEGANVSMGGWRKLNGLVDNLDSQVTSKIAASPATVSTADVVSNVRPTLQKFTAQVDPNADIAAINSVSQNFINHPWIQGAAQIPVQTAQELKRGTYRVLRGKYGELGSASTEAQKSLGHGLMEGVSNAVPEVAPLNARMGDAINALDPLEHRLIVELRKNPMGLSLVAPTEGKLALFLADKSSLFKSIIARMMNAGQETIPAVAVGGSIPVINGALGDKPINGVLNQPR